MTVYEMKAMFKVTWDGMRKNHFQHMHSKQEEEQAESRLVDYKKRIGLTREMNSLLNKQTTEVQETPHSKRTRSQALQGGSQAKQDSSKKAYNTKPSSKDAIRTNHTTSRQNNVIDPNNQRDALKYGTQPSHESIREKMKKEGLAGMERDALRLESPQKVTSLVHSSPLVKQLGVSPKKKATKQ